MQSYVDFNTSNVTIQQLSSQIKRGDYIISIHLMLLFNTEPSRFLHIPIGISIHLMLLFN